MSFQESRASREQILGTDKKCHFFDWKIFISAIYDIWHFWKLLEDFQEIFRGGVTFHEIAVLN